MSEVTEKPGKLTLTKVLKRKRLLSIYFTAGYPKLEDTPDILLSLQRTGVDLIEIGFPFSDPVADGPIIQNSSYKAILNGMSLKKLFSQLESIKDEILIPVILMGYLNPVMQFGMENFCTRCKELGISGVIIPDLPVYEFKSIYAELFKQNNLSFIFLITPATTEERIHEIDSLSTSFIYAVSNFSTTGAQGELAEFQKDYLFRLSTMNLKHPILTGFGISNRAMFRTICELVSGGIIGSAFIDALSKGRNINNSILRFINEIKQ